ncbi:MAG: hypothetical protein DHS20C10_09660 [marine bacterium B5-7]|nr:MAG: hypothetical protein DHS20C10_09660 [marine bacterium B5-7]
MADLNGHNKHAGPSDNNDSIDIEARTLSTGSGLSAAMLVASKGENTFQAMANFQQGPAAQHTLTK